MIVNTLLSDELRKKHAEDLSLGCGNFLHKAVALSPYANEQHFFLDRKVSTFTGEVYEGFSLKELEHVVDTYASFYYGIGVRAKDPVGVFIGEGIENLIHFLAINAIGAIPAIVNGNMPSEIAALWLEKVGAVGLYADTDHAVRISPHVGKNSQLKFLVTDETAPALFKPSLPLVYPFQHDPKDAVQIGHSSGTTGIPKAVEFQHQQFFYGIRYRLGLPFAKGAEKLLSALPHSHSAGMAYIMLSVLSGASTMILSSNKPETVLPNLKGFEPTMVVAFPETYVLLCDSVKEEDVFPTVRLWFNGGDAAHEPHIKRLLKLAPGSVFIDGLGSSEMGFSLFRHVHTEKGSLYDRCIGKPLEFVDAKVFGVNGEVLPPFQIGRLGVKSPSITPGYWNDSVLTARSKIDGYFLTGDIFYHDTEGRFFHIDRIPDVIQTKAGPVYSLETEELILKNFEDVSDCTVIASEGATAFVRLKKGRNTSSTDLLSRVNHVLSSKGRNLLSQLVFTNLEEIPLGPTGKVLKRQLRDRFQKRKVETKTMEPLHA